MQENEIKELLEKVKTGDRSVDDALKALKDIPYHEMGFANVDHHRALRTGFPEAIFGQGKSAEQISAIMTELLRKTVDMTPAGIIKRFDLRRPIYADTAANGHFGVEGRPWEKTDLAEELKALV